MHKADPTPQDIIKLRKKIAKIDKQFLRILKTRFALNEKVARHKLFADLPIENEDVEAELYKKWKKLFKRANTASPDFLEELFELIIGESKAIQQDYFDSHK